MTWSQAYEHAFYIIQDDKTDMTALALKASFISHGVSNVLVVSNLAVLTRLSAAIKAVNNYVVCNIETFDKWRVSEFKKVTNFAGLLVFSSVQDETSLKLAASIPEIIFLSHNNKEIRRAVTWIASAGGFTPTGEPFAPPRLDQRRGCPPPSRKNNQNIPPKNTYGTPVSFIGNQARRGKRNVTEPSFREKLHDRKVSTPCRPSTESLMNHSSLLESVNSQNSCGWRSYDSSPVDFVKSSNARNSTETNVSYVDCAVEGPDTQNWDLELLAVDDIVDLVNLFTHTQ